MADKVSVRQRIVYAAGDLLACEAATLVFNLARHLRIHSDGAVSFADWSCDPYVRLSYLAFPCVMLLIYAVLGFYNDPIYKSRYELVTNSALGALLGSLAIYFATMVNDNFNERSIHYSLLLILWLSYFVMTTGVRFVIRALLLMRAVDGVDTFNVVVVGPPAEAEAYAVRLETNNRRMGYRVVGLVGNSDDAVRESVKYEIISYDDLPEFIIHSNVKAFVVIASRDRQRESIEAINRLIPLGLTILLPIDIYNIVTSRPKLSNIIGEPLVDITTPGLSAAASNLKRIGDVIVSACALIALVPVGLVIACLIKLDSPGPVFYRQERVGLHGRKFYIVKFRSMIVDAEKSGPALSSSRDDRITRVGHVLRKYRFDELPQFWNVFRGDMSLVGPRPEREFYLEQLRRLEPSVCTIHNVRPGLTSLGMVKYGYASDLHAMTERLYYDLLYVENISFPLDLKILFHTVNTVITGKGI